MPIKFNLQFLIPGFLGLALVTAILPSHANAFWPFSVKANAATTNASIPSSSTPTLKATLNSNPNLSPPIALDTSGDSALVSHSGPDGNVANATPSDGNSIYPYPVRPGDTLSNISEWFGVSVATIKSANNLSGAGNIHPGDILLIPPVSGITLTVARGDTLKSLAQKYGGDTSITSQFNNLDVNASLVVGSRIFIPGGEMVTLPQNIKKSAPENIASEPRRIDEGTVSVPSGYYGNPVPGAILTQGVHDHNAVDLSYSGGARGMPIYAAAAGQVTSVSENGSYNQGWGNDVVINHTNGTQTLYAHMSSVAATVGQNVLGGDIIGFIGSTGKTRGAHLHLEVHGAPNPFRYCRVGSVCSPQ